MPEAFAGAEIERQNAIAVQTRALAVAAIHIVSRRTQREIADSALFVDGDFAPGVDTADVRPGILGPRIVAELARTGNGVERPDELAADHVVGAQITGRRSVHFAGLRPDDEKIFEDA